MSVFERERVCVCVRERERERKTETGRERESERDDCRLLSRPSFVTALSLAVFPQVRERGRERQNGEGEEGGV